MKLMNTTKSSPKIQNNWMCASRFKILVYTLQDQTMKTIIKFVGLKFQPLTKIRRYDRVQEMVSQTKTNNKHSKAFAVKNFVLSLNNTI